MSYALMDFTESLSRVQVAAGDIEKVIAAWGMGNGGEPDYRHGETGTDWSGGFLMQLKDGRFAYLTGWCDYTGWGCQDGAELTYYDTHPGLPVLAKDDDGAPHPEAWDYAPADLNKWLGDQVSAEPA